MDPYHYIRAWLLMQVFMLPLSFFSAWIMSLSVGPSPMMLFTQLREVPADHPLLEIRKGVLHYLGGAKYPLPRKFGWFSAWPFLVLFPGITSMNTLEKLGLGLGWRLTILALIGMVLALPIVLLFRRLQPRWLNAHLAGLPADAKPPVPPSVQQAEA